MFIPPHKQGKDEQCPYGISVILRNEDMSVPTQYYKRCDDGGTGHMVSVAGRDKLDPYGFYGFTVFRMYFQDLAMDDATASAGMGRSSSSLVVLSSLITLTSLIT